VILPPDATSLKLWAFPERHLLADAWGEMERLDFEAPRGLPDAQRRALRFPVRRAGTFRGFVIKMAAGVASPPRTKWTRRVPHPVLIGHAASLTPY